MTAPNSPVSEAFSDLSSLLANNDTLAGEPGVVYALQKAQATPEQASAVNAFMQAAELGKQVQILRSQGTKVTFTDAEKQHLAALGVPYTDVELTAADKANATQSLIEQRSAGLLTAKRDKNGKIVTKNGEPVVVTNSSSALTVAEAKAMADKLGYDFQAPTVHRGFFGNIGHFLNQEVVQPVWRDVVKPVGNVAMKGLNLVNSDLTSGPPGLQTNVDWATAANDVIKGNAANPLISPEKGVQISDARANDMTAKGYNPTDPWSVLAYQASGKAINDDTDAVQKYGQDAVNKMDAYLSNPEAVRKQIEDDPNSWTTNEDGQKEFTKEATSKLNWYSSDEAREIAGSLQASGATVGNLVTNALGVDPVAHPELYAVSTAASNLAAAFVIDPLMITGKAFKAAKTAEVGRTFDSNILASRMDPVAGPQTRRLKALRSNVQNFLDLTHAQNKAALAGDSVTAARLDGELASRYPELNPLRDEVLGRYRRVIDGPDGKPVIDQYAGKPIYEIGDLADYLASHHGASRLMMTKAAASSAYMPGAVSAKGARLIKGKMAGWLNARSARRALNAESSVVSRAEADPAFAQNWLDEGKLVDLQPEADDAVDGVTGEVIQSKSGNVARDLQLAIDLLAVHTDALEEQGQLAPRLTELKQKFDDLWNNSIEIDPVSGQLTWREGAGTPDELSQIGDEIDETHRLLSDAVQNAEDTKLGAAAADARINPPDQALANLPASQLRAGRKYALTPKGVGAASYNMRRYGNYVGDRRLGGWAAPRAVAARARLGAQRVSHLLPRNTKFSITGMGMADKVYDYMLQYGDRASASAMRTLWINGDGGTRKAIIDGMIDQTAEAAGLAKTKAGQELMRSERATVQQYSTAGDRLFANGQPIPMSSSQTNLTWNLSDFRQLQHAASKVGLWEATMGRALTAYQLDTLMGVLKMGWLFRPATVSRNWLEGWMNAALRGQLGDAMKAKAAASIRNSEAWSKGFGLEAKNKYEDFRQQIADLDEQISGMKGAKGVGDLRQQRAGIARLMTELEHDPAVAHMLLGEKLDELKLTAGNDLLKQDEIKKLTKQQRDIANASLMTGKQLGRSAFTDRASQLLPFALAGRAYRAIYGRDLTEGVLSSLETLGAQELAEAMENYTRQVMSGTVGLEQAAKESKKVAENGFGPSYVRYVREAYSRETKGAQEVKWLPVEVHGQKGIDQFANALALRVNESPQVARAALDVIQDGAPISGVVDAMDTLDTTKAHLMGWGERFWPKGTGDAVTAVTDDEKAIGKIQQAREIVADYRALLTGRNGDINPDLAQYINDNGLAPTSDWLSEKLTLQQMPESVVAPEVTALSNGDKKGLVASLLDLTGAGYAWMVERPLQRTTTSPVFLANYANARYNLNSEVEAMVEAGLSQTAAEAFAKEVAVKNAWIKTEATVDDPGQKSQFDIVARNIFPFSRAMQAMIRRWGSLMWRDPLAAHKMQLAYEGAVHSGLIYDNDYGEPTFVYPASGVFGGILQELSKLPGPLHGIAKFPLASDMTGGVLMAVPGAENPLRLSMSPFVMMPLRELKGLLPGNEQIMFDELDSAINGPIGVGETWSQFEPTVFKNFYRAMNPDERSTAYASAAAGAIANLAAAGMVPPPDAPPAEQQAFMDSLRTQIRNQLFTRAVFGLFAPASPSNPTEAVSAKVPVLDKNGKPVLGKDGKPKMEAVSSDADYAFRVQGIKSMDSEYKRIINDVDGDLGRANVIWTAMHPDDVVYNQDGAIESARYMASAYETPESESTTSKSDIPDTETGLRWMTENKDFIKKYSSVAAYFLPEAATGEPFNDQAYNLQYVMGLRQRKTPQEFLNDVQIRNAESVYFPTVDKVQAQIDAMRAAGQTHQAADLNNSLNAWKEHFKQQNAAFGDKLASYDLSESGAVGQLKDLALMVQNGDVPDGLGPTVGLLVKNYEGYEQFYNEHRGSDSQDEALRKGALNLLNAWAQQHLPAGSGLRDLWNGVFHALNTNLSTLPTGEGQ